MDTGDGHRGRFPVSAVRGARNGDRLLLNLQIYLMDKNAESAFL